MDLSDHLSVHSRGVGAFSVVRYARTIVKELAGVETLKIGPILEASNRLVVDVWWIGVQMFSDFQALNAL